MISWIFSNIQNITTGASILAAAIVGGFYFFDRFHDREYERRKEADDVADTLINRLKERIEQMASEMSENTKNRDAEIKDLRTRVDHLTGRNSMLEDLFKGRDPLMQDFYKKAPKLIEGVVKNGEDLRKLEQTLAKFVDTLQPVLMHIKLNTSGRKTKLKVK